MKQEVKLFPAQKSSEKVLTILRRHWFTYMLFWVIAIAMSLPLVVGVVYLVSNYSIIDSGMINISILVGSAYTLLVLALFLHGFIDFYLDIYIVTDHRIVDIKQNGFFNRSISELNLRQVQDVKASVKGIFPTLVHYGDVYIQTAGEMENFHFKDIPHPYRVSILILEMHEAVLKKDDGECDDNSGDLSHPSMKDFEEGKSQEGNKDTVQVESIIQGTNNDTSEGDKEEKTGQLREGQITKL